MTQKPVTDLLFLFIVLAILYFISNKLSESFDVIQDSSEKSTTGTKACSRDSVNKSILDYIFKTRHSVR